jgi:hypothetical protein
VAPNRTGAGPTAGARADLGRRGLRPVVSASHQHRPVSAVTWTDRAGHEVATCTCGRQIERAGGSWQYTRR